MGRGTWIVVVQFGGVSTGVNCRADSPLGTFRNGGSWFGGKRCKEPAHSIQSKNTQTRKKSHAISSRNPHFFCIYLSQVMEGLRLPNSHHSCGLPLTVGGEPAWPASNCRRGLPTEFEENLGSSGIAVTLPDHREFRRLAHFGRARILRGNQKAWSRSPSSPRHQ